MEIEKHELMIDKGPQNMSSHTAPWNASSLELGDIAMDRNFLLLVVSLATGALWLTYITYYNSRVLGYLLTRILNKIYFREEHFKIGSVTLSALAGKIMFRDVVYVTYDYSVRVQDGYLIFRWWRSYVPKDVSEDLSHSDTRLSLVLNGFELHVYNRCAVYSELERVFGLEGALAGGDEGGAGGGRAARGALAGGGEAARARTWRDLVPVVKVDVCSARVVFGNRLVPSTLSLSAEEAHLVYSTKPPASRLDQLMHFVKAKADNCKVLLAPSPNYTSMVDEPPRYMGEGFVVMSSNYMELYLYLDEPGLVPERPVPLQLANGDVVESAPPVWGVDVKCGKGTDFSYGPWADRQRDHLFKFFFPPDYRTLEVTPPPRAGEPRRVQAFDVRLSTLNEATVDVLFSKHAETSAVHVNVGAGSYLEVTLPWTVQGDGYVTRITGQLLHVEASTSLPYRSLLECETLEYTVRCHYPRVWNHHQSWQLSLTGCKATAHLVYTHVDFFQDLVEDWASDERPDALRFVPYTWKISLVMKECEVVTVSNRHNWIDCSSTNQENEHVAFCGDLLDVSFDLPFVDFLPDTVPIKVWVQGEAVQLSLHLPEVHTARPLLLSLDQGAKLSAARLRPSKWRRRCVRTSGWVDCWSVPLVALSVRYVYHPSPPLGPAPQADITTPEKEEILLSPMRIPRARKQPPLAWAADARRFDRSSLTPDRVTVELEVGPSVLLAYGTLVPAFLNLLENLFGEDRTFTDMAREPEPAPPGEPPEPLEREPFDPRRYRPLDVQLSLVIHDVRAHLVKNCSESEPPCPVVVLERLGFEMDKSFRETKLQLLLSPSVLTSSDAPARSESGESALQRGHLVLSSLQLRGHALFSAEGRAAHEDTLEYAWLLELQLGRLTGRLTPPQLLHVAAALETFVLLACDAENELDPPRARAPAAAQADARKYRMLRVGVDLLDVAVCEPGTAMRIRAQPLRAALCNLQHAALSALVPSVVLAVYTRAGDSWLRAAHARLGPLQLEAGEVTPAQAEAQRAQREFLEVHDRRTRRLWFLWEARAPAAASCGCVGGCVFFGSNRAGATFLRASPGEPDAAQLEVSDRAGELGYGQSLLHMGQLVFRTPPYSGGRRVCLQPAPAPPPAAPAPAPPTRRTPAEDAPQLESSASDSRLALSCATDAPPAPSRRSLEEPAPPLEVQRTTSVTSENHSEAFFSADEDMFPSRSSSLKHARAPPPAAPSTPAPAAAAAATERAPSESGSLSSTSFISAISSQEDMSLVNLRMQTSRPISDSPLLMSSYGAHVPQYRCTDWSACSLPAPGDALPLPLLRRADDGGLHYTGDRYMPHFEPLARAPPPLRIRPRTPTTDNTDTQQSPPGPRAHPFPPAWWDEEGDAATDERRTRLALSVRGDVQVTLTPLALEAAQRFVESLTPVLSGRHPVSVVSHVRLLCIASVRRANVLKQRPHVEKWAGRAPAEGGGRTVHEECVSERVSASVSVARVDVVLLQTSVVEDLITFSALDEPHELTCASVLALSAEGVSCEYAGARRALETVQLHHRPGIRLAGKKAGLMRGLMAGGGRKRGPERGEPVYLEAGQTQSDDTALQVRVSRLHAQLRRLRGEGAARDACVTGIPATRCEACFEVVRAEGGESCAGPVLAECGVEGVCVRGGQRARASAPHEAASSPPRTPPPPPPPQQGSRGALQPVRDAGNASSCSLDVRLVWFNFAAPPPPRPARRLDSARSDWNLVSTASPAINAWLNPASRLGGRALRLYRGHARRQTATAAALMAGALDAGTPAAPRSRYARHSLLARALREEPALALCGALLRHALLADAAALQADLAERHVPPLSALRQGVLVLSRQWKNALYTPLLLDNNYRSEMLRPLDVTFAPDLLEQPPAHPAHDETCLLLDLDLEGRGGVGSREDVREDLYQWMARQQAWGPAYSVFPVSGPRVLLDAHQVFRPLLQALGVAPHAPPALDALGSKLAVQAWVDTVRVHIAVSESGARAAEPAFVAERVSLEAEAARVADAALRELARRRDALYVSRSQIKRHVGTVVNFTGGARSIAQQVNMPLLRLLHQLDTMWHNVKHTQAELRAQTRLSQRRAEHRDSVSEVRENPASVSSLDKDSQLSVSGVRWEEPAPRPARPPSRPQSFAQKLRSTGKSVKGKLGYSSLSEGAHTPMVGAGAGASVPPAEPAGGAPPAGGADKLAPRCWRTVYLLLELYANMPAADTMVVSGEGGSAGVVLVGVARIHRTRLLASLSGLRLEAELTSLQGSVSASRARTCSLTVTLGRSNIVLVEGGAPDAQPVVRVAVGKSQALHSWEPATAVISVGVVRVDLPQHPVALHGVVTRSSRQLSSTLQELGVGVSRARAAPVPPSPPPAPRRAPPPRPAPPRGPPLQLQLTVSVQSVSVTAALLPSLQAQYKMDHVSGSGVTGVAAHFTVELPQHSLSFVTRVPAGESTLPPAAMVALPAVHAAARVVDAGGASGAPEGAVLRAGRYLAATADIGLFEHTLSTDLLNHLVFVQKVFMKEVNEVVQKVYGGEQPVPLWAEGDTHADILLYSLTIRIQRIQLTATTPSNSAVRLETGAVTLELSNRVQNVPPRAGARDARLFARAQVDLNLSLGQLLRNAVFEEAEPEFQQYAFFNTRIAMRNALQEEAGGAPSPDKEVVLITLKRPLVYVQPVAVDRAVLVWLNYKNAYDYWAEQRRSLHTDVLQATHQLLEKVSGVGGGVGGGGAGGGVGGAGSPGTLLLRLDVDDIGVCLPLHAPPAPPWPEPEPRGAVVVTLESTSVSACSRGALVSKGRFVGLCLRFAPEFEASLDDWQPRADEPPLNVCRVSEGTYEVCSRTAGAGAGDNPKWFLHVSWQMEGVDIRLDVSVGKQLSALGHTLTMLTGVEEEDGGVRCAADGSSGDEEDECGAEAGRARSRLAEREMSEQAKIVADLRALGASAATIDAEVRRLHDLEALVFKDFRRDVMQRLRRRSVKASSITKGKLGLGSNRSRSFVAPSPPPCVVGLGAGDSGETLLPGSEPGSDDDEPRLADIVEGGSWSSVESARPSSERWPPDRDSLEGVELRRKPDTRSGVGGVGDAGKEPSIDLELDVKVRINSGKCVLHTRDAETETRATRSGRVARSSSGGLEAGSPGAARRRPPTPELTVFRVPGLDLRVHYDSKTVSEEGGRRTSKRAALLAWITLQSIPEETIVSPHILEFLERALEPIPLKAFTAAAAAAGGGGAGDESGVASYGQYVYASFPVDVIVHFHMQPSTFRFSCLPASRVECLLQLPSLQIVFSSKRAADEEVSSPGVALGGLSVTGCLADFSVYVFHPYGGKKAAPPAPAQPASPRAHSERKDSLSINVEFVKFHLSRSRKLDFADLDHSKAAVRFSTIVDVGCAWFKYDMRRLGEILAFPKAWYRRTIVRRMFLGDLSVEQRPPPPAPAHAPRPRADTPRGASCAGAEGGAGSESAGVEVGAEWETLVLFAVNFTRLNVHMNMGNVMGNVSWQSRDFSCTGRLSIGSTGHRDMLVGVALAGSSLDARGGIVGGAISLASIGTYVHVRGEVGRPGLAGGARVQALELRLEYMGSPALLARVSRLALAARDAAAPTPRPLLLLHATLAWHQLQVVMSRSTTPDLLKMQLKLEEFFTQQFKSSRRVFSALHPEYRASRAPPAPPPAAPDNTEGELRHHRHWQRALRVEPLVLGGTMELHGAHISLACFHGNSLKAKSWALFSLKDPCISFATEAQRRAAGDVLVAQSLTASLGAPGPPAPAAGHQSMATVCRMTRAKLFPPQFKTLREWFQYAFAGSEIDAIEQFPSLEREGGGAGGSGVSGGARVTERHVREVIFALPALQLHLRTGHTQAQHAPTHDDEKPVVECSFITEFEDHIFVSVDAEAFLFLHDLIAEYIAETARVAGGPRGEQGGAGGLASDYRQYRCVTWHLEPTVRLLSWAGKSIEPYGVDYILQKLGFSHARTTIPKWVQRGALDPLDKLLAMALLRLVTQHKQHKH